MEVNEQTDKLNSPRRGYHSPKRQRQAEATRLRILVAAERLFAAHSYAAVTMAAIAREADVSLATLYLYYQGRTAVVGALAEELAAAPELSVELVEQGDQNADPRELLQVGAHIMRQLNERAWLVVDILRSQQGNDPEMARLLALSRQRHLDAMQRAVRALAARGVLRPEIEPQIAADALYALAGTEVYRALAMERGWSPDDYERWLFETACRELLQ